MKEDEEVEEYFQVFERSISSLLVPAVEWVANLVPRLNDKSRSVYLELSVEESKDYEKNKVAILEPHQLTEDHYRHKFRTSQKIPGEDFVMWAKRTCRYLDSWMRVAGAAGDLGKVLEQFMMEKMYDSVSAELRIWLKERKPETAVELGRLANEHVQAKKGPLVDGKYVGYTEVVRSRQKSSNKETETSSYTAAEKIETLAQSKPQVQCYNCQAFGHYASRCPLPDRRKEVKKKENAYLCVTPLERELAYDPSYISGEIEGGRANMLADSGCSRTLVNRRFVDPSRETGHAITVLTASGEKVRAPLATVQIKSKAGNHTELVGVLDNLPVDCLLGKSSYCKTLTKDDILRHWENVTGIHEEADSIVDNNVIDDQAFVVTRRQALLRAAQEREEELINRENNLMSKTLAPPNQSRSVQTTSEKKVHDISALFNETDEVTGSSRDKLDVEAEAVSHSVSAGTADELTKESNTVVKQRNILDRNRSQVIEDQLKDNNLNSIRVEDQAPTDHDGYFKDNGLIMHRKFNQVEHNGVKYFDRIVIPQAYRPEILRVAHSLPLAGHMGQNKTRERIEPHFYWPGCHKEINNYCATCPECQMVVRKTKALRAPLKPVPIVSEPFNKVAMDLIGELPRSKNGFKYILTLVDYATRYPEAIPLRGISSKLIADALISIFCRVGIPNEIVSDQGSNLIGELMNQLYKSLGVKKINVSTYHPEANGLVERFNGTLKSLLRKFIDENIRDWDKFIPYILFAYREVPNSSTGYSPLELLHGRMIRGPLSVIKESWMSKNNGESNLLSYILEFRRRMSTMQEAVSETLKESQVKQKRLYDQQSSQRKFEVGDKVIVLLPTPGSKLESKWTGPYSVTVVHSDGRNYTVDTHNKRKRFRVYNVNLLKKWQDRDEIAALAVQDCLAEGFVHENDNLLNTGNSETWEDVEISEQLTPEQTMIIENLLKDFSDVFSGLPNRTTAAVHMIDTGDAMSIRSSPYRVPQTLQDEYNKEIDSMLQLGIIRPSTSAWASPVVIVPKPDKTIRFCVDYRRLNNVTKMDAFPIPRVEEMLEKVASANFISTLDLTKGYWQVPLDKASQSKSAFITPRGLFEYTVMPFGMKTAPATFQRMMTNKVLAGTKCKADAYIDDVEVDSSNFNEHVKALQETLQRLRDNRLNARPSKCKIAMPTVRLLGHIVGHGTIRPRQALVQTISNLPRPKTKKEVRSILGLFGYYRKFIPNFAQRAIPLTDLTRGAMSNKVQWSEDCERAFAELKHALQSYPVLQSPKWDREFILQVDASNRGLGAVLCQNDDEGEEHPICFASRKLLPRETVLSTTEKECLAIIWAVEKFRYYLFGRTFMLQTDHNPLVWLNRVKDKNRKLLSWSLILQEYDIQIEHKSGVKHQNVDALSRL